MRGKVGADGIEPSSSRVWSRLGRSPLFAARPCSGVRPQADPAEVVAIIGERVSGEGPSEVRAVPDEGGEQSTGTRRPSTSSGVLLPRRPHKGPDEPEKGEEDPEEEHPSVPISYGHEPKREEENHVEEDSDSDSPPQLLTSSLSELNGKA
jgi:hypothetical protein